MDSLRVTMSARLYRQVWMAMCVLAMLACPVLAGSAESIEVARKGHVGLSLQVSAAQLEAWSKAEPTIFRGRPLSGDSLPLAIDDFKRAVGQMVDAPFPETLADGVAVKLVYQPELAKTMDYRGVNIHVKPGEIVMEASSRLGLMNGLYTLLDGWGCRWVKAGKFGEVIPAKETLTLPVGTMQFIPASDSEVGMLTYRGQAVANDPWTRRNRMGTDRWFTAQHYWGHIVPQKEYLESHPEYYALIGGKRTPSQICTTNPQVIELAIAKAREFFSNYPHATSFPMDPNDNLDFCQCENCVALDPPGDYRGLLKRSDRVVTFANHVAEMVEKEYPGKTVSYYAYWSHQLPPERVKPRKNVVVQVCRSNFTYIQVLPGSNYQGAGSAEDFEAVLDGWRAVVGNRMYTYEYTPVYWAGQLPCPNFLGHAQVVKNHYAKGVRGRHEDSSDPQSPTNYLIHYLSNRMLSNPTLDPVEELRDTCLAFFGPAGQAMFDYYMTLSESMQYDGFVGGGVNGYERMFTPDQIGRARQAMNRAIEAAQTPGEFKDRVVLIDLTHQYLENFVHGVWSAQAGDYDQSMAHFDNVDKLIEQINAMDYLPMSESPRRLKRARLVTIAKHFPVKLGFAQSWYVLGPFDNDKRDAIFRPESFETNGRILPTARQVTDRGQSAKWKLYRSDEGFVHFDKAFRGVEKDWDLSFAYAMATVHSPEARTVQFRMDSFNSFRVFVNGKEVYYRPGLDEDEPDKRKVNVPLHQGNNQILIKVSQTTPAGIEGLMSAWGFYFRITDGDGNLIPGLRFNP